MYSERNQEIKNEIKDSTFVENHEGRVSAESNAGAPEVSFEQKKIEKKESLETNKSENKKETQNLSEKKGLGYEINDLDEDVAQTSDFSSSNTWRKVLREKGEL